jgi:hypothetical protein
MVNEKEFLEQEGWAILDENAHSENDFRLGAIPKKSLEDFLKNTKADKPKYFYNQYTDPNTRYSCTLFWSFGAVSDLTWYQFTKEDINQINKRAISLWLDPHKGWWTRKAVDLIRKWWN